MCIVAIFLLLVSSLAQTGIWQKDQKISMIFNQLAHAIHKQSYVDALT